MSTQSYPSISMRIVLLLALLAGIFAATPAQAVASIRYVKWDAGGANNGTSWANAYTTLQSALSAAAFGDEIWVAAGTYKPTTDTDRTASFTLKNGVSIYGGFAGHESSRGQRNPAVNVTSLSGDIGTLGAATDNTFHVLTGNSGGSALVDGFTITGGNADRIEFNMNGGGLYKPGSGNLDLSNMIFSHNSADDSGGGLFASGGTLTLNSVTFDQNTASSHGGGFAMTSGNLTVTNASFDGNFADLGGGLSVTGNSQLANVSFHNNTAASNGGGLYTTGNVSLTGVTFFGNHIVEGMGGAIASHGGTLAVTGSTFTNNNAVVDPYFIGGGGEGGAIYTLSLLTVTNSTFEGNQASRGGALSCNTMGEITSTGSAYVSNSALSDSGGDGGAIFANCHSTMVRNTFASNTAAHYGGAILANNDIDLSNVINSTFYGNVAQAGSGGGIANFGGLAVRSSTFSHNNASNGGAIRNGLGGSLSLTNSILANSVGGMDCTKSDSTPEVENISNLIETTGSDLASCGSSLLTSDPVLGSLQDNGGPTQTMALLPGSPAINPGTNTDCPATDQRGVPRPQQGQCDIGAYESLVVTPFKSGGPQDGWVLESSETSNQGGTLNPTSATFILGDNAGNRQYRSILSFNTASLPDNAVITKVVLKIRKQGLTGTNPFTTHLKIAVDIRKGAFSNNAALQASDFQAATNKPGVGLFANTPQAGGWYVTNLKSTAYRYINRTGITQFRLRFQTDDDNDAAADFLRFYSGNAIAANRPVLVIEYYVP